MLLSQGHFSMGQTIAAFAGQNYGIRDTGRIRKGCSIAFRMMLVYSITTGILVNVLLPYLLPLFFTGDVAIREILPWSRTFVRINTLFYQPLAMIFIYRSAMQGCNYSMRAMTLGIVELAARTVLALASMRLGSYELAVAADGAAWLAAGVYGILLYYVTMGQLERRLALSARSG
jgi:Na+-driven multidrug efflux pump